MNRSHVNIFRFCPQSVGRQLPMNAFMFPNGLDFPEQRALTYLAKGTLNEKHAQGRCRDLVPPEVICLHCMVVKEK